MFTSSNIMFQIYIVVGTYVVEISSIVYENIHIYQMKRSYMPNKLSMRVKLNFIFEAFLKKATCKEKKCYVQDFFAVVLHQ
jgi:hypothetical protein